MANKAVARKLTLCLKRLAKTDEHFKIGFIKHNITSQTSWPRRRVTAPAPSAESLSSV